MILMIYVMPSIYIRDNQKETLDKLKIHPKVPYCDVLDELLKPIELPSFTPEERKDFLEKIERLRESVKKRMERAKGGEKI